MTEAGLSLDQVTVRYPQEALSSLSLQIGVGEVVALLGPSGCGKSTVLRAVAGLQPLAGGRIGWAGQDLANIPVHRRGFGLMFQEGQLFPHRDVAGNVGYGLPRAPDREHRIGQLLELVGLAGYQHRQVRTLSGGEQQRVALARALAPQPRVLLLDEPLSALDRGLREHLVSELAHILRAAGTTALYVTHDHHEAFVLADRIALMRQGQLRQVGTAQELWQAPADPQAAQFLGYRLVAHGPGTLALGPRALTVVGAAQHRATEGVVETMHWWQGELVAVIETDAWGPQRVLVGGAQVAVGERVGIALDHQQTVSFAQEVLESDRGEFFPEYQP
ncbi:MAG: ABC transporter ATP-binding protein [Beutenbergiaceae bacterium]